MSAEIMNARQIAEKAATLVSEDRAAQHGDKVVNHECIAALWNGYLRALHTAIAMPWMPDLTAHDVANMMECLKIARRLSGGFNVDDYVDGAGYAACAGEIAARS